MIRLARRLTLLAFLGMLISCAQLRELPSGALAPGAFDLTGRFSLRFRQDASTGRVQWRHSDPADDLLITNPLGQGVARITRTANHVALETADGQAFEAGDAEDLTEKSLGWRLPLAGLPYWVRGRAKPGSEAQTVRDATGRVAELRQEGWLIQYESFAEASPERIHLSRPDLDLRLVIESFSSGTP